MATYKTPGVYVEEISTLPPSVAEVSTAIPAFLGYTQMGAGKVARISTLLDFETLFGKAQAASFTISARSDATTQATTLTGIERTVAEGAAQFLLYYSMQLYFQNGGGTCYIISVGGYDAMPDKQHFFDGLAELEKEDEPTIIVMPDAVNLLSDDYYAVCQQALAQCNKLGDRFAVLDVLDGDVSGFRNKIGTANLLYGAAYHPYLATTLNYQYSESSVTVNMERAAAAAATWTLTQGDAGILASYSGNEGDDPRVRVVSGDAADDISFAISDTNVLTISGVAAKTGNDVVQAWTTWSAANEAGGFNITAANDGSGEVPNSSNANLPMNASGGTQADTSTLAANKTSNTSLYHQAKSLLAQQRVTLPPSGAMAGVYARVDRERGVWKAPANVSLMSVIGPVEKITHEAQENLNVDPTAGKSINAIRAFAGKGTLVWGARTLAGNDNEWRYVSVRRLFNVIEESAQKSTAFAVFEPNDATTWLKVKAMIESYLYGLWEQGALAGPTPEAAYFVNVGLGKTMTTQDVLEGRMNVEIGIAAVRPAEFIILKFSHKLQEA